MCISINESLERWKYNYTGVFYMKCIGADECSNNKCMHKIRHIEIIACRLPCQNTKGLKRALNCVDDINEKEFTQKPI